MDNDLNINTPLISIILPVYNGSRFIKLTIESLLNQNYNNFELIIINDGSTDNSLEIIKSFVSPKILYYDQQNIGVAKTLNKGISYAKGKYIARIDQDDLVLRDRFSYQVNFLENNSDYSMISGSVIYIDENNREISRSFSITENKLLKYYLFYKGCIIFHPTVMFKKDDIVNIQCYSEQIGDKFTDYYTWVKFLRLGYNIKNSSKAFIKYRLNTNSITSTFSLTSIGDKILKRLLFEDNLTLSDTIMLNNECVKGYRINRLSFTHKIENLIYNIIQKVIGSDNSLKCISFIKNKIINITF